MSPAEAIVRGFPLIDDALFVCGSILRLYSVIRSQEIVAAVTSASPTKQRVLHADFLAATIDSTFS